MHACGTSRVQAAVTRRRRWCAMRLPLRQRHHSIDGEVLTSVGYVRDMKVFIKPAACAANAGEDGSSPLRRYRAPRHRLIPLASPKVPMELVGRDFVDFAPPGTAPPRYDLILMN